MSYGPPKEMPPPPPGGVRFNDLLAVKNMLARANVHCFIRVTDRHTAVIATGMWGESKHAQATHGVVEFLFNPQGELIALEGINERIPPMGFWARMQWWFGGSRGHR